MDRNALLGSYLKQQSSIVYGGSSQRAPSEVSVPASVTKSVAQSVTQPTTTHELVHVDQDSLTLDEFKEYVKKYIEIDTWLKKAQDVTKEKKKQKKLLSDIIMKFMIKYDIEDLNCKTGKIRCKVKQVKQPISQRVIKEKITDYFKDKQTTCADIIQKVFNDRPVIEKVSLRHLKIT